MSLEHARAAATGFALVLLCGSVIGSAQTTYEKPASPAKPAAKSDDMSSMFMKPGPEHQRLVKVVGKWTATQKVYMAPGAPPMTVLGTSETKSICHGMWFETTYKAGPFEGHAIDGYDPVKKKYVGVWVDNQGPSMGPWEADVDPSGAVIGTMSMPDSTGQTQTFTMREEWKDDDTREWKMYKGASAEGQPMMEISYKRVAKAAAAAKSPAK